MREAPDRRLGQELQDWNDCRQNARAQGGHRSTVSYISGYKHCAIIVLILDLNAHQKRDRTQYLVRKGLVLLVITNLGLLLTGRMYQSSEFCCRIIGFPVRMSGQVE